MGDCLLLTSPIRALKEEFPGFRISVLVESRFAGCFDGNPDIDEVLAITRKKEGLRLARRRFKLVVNLHAIERRGATGAEDVFRLVELSGIGGIGATIEVPLAAEHEHWPVPAQEDAPKKNEAGASSILNPRRAWPSG